MSARHTVASSVGQRANNEDACFAAPGLYAVADGTDGMSELAEDEIARVVAASTGADIADALVQRALERGASDNVTVVAVMVL